MNKHFYVKEYKGFFSNIPFSLFTALFLNFYKMSLSLFYFYAIYSSYLLPILHIFISFKAGLSVLALCAVPCLSAELLLQEANLGFFFKL